MRVLFCVCVVALAALFSSPASAERRVALVIGNGAYAKVPKLANPTNDAGAMEALLKAAGFDKVVRADNLGAAQMRRALRDFTDEVRDADIAVVFYAGHGMEMNGTNYLIPVDAVLERDIDVADETVSLDRINQVLEPANRLRLIILDACRDNPFVRSIRRTLASRSIGRGLASVEVATADTLIAYAAKAGSTAADGGGANSPYTAAMVKHLTTPGLDVRLALGRVRDEVLRTTSRRQEPFVYGSLGGAEVPLIAAPRQPVVPPPPVADGATASAAAEAWNRIKETRDTAVLEAFLARFGDTFFGDLAKSRLAALRQEQQRLALLQKQEEDRKRAEAAAAEARARTEEEATKSPRPQPTRLTREIQLRLIELQCLKGRADGIWGSITTSAAADFNFENKGRPIAIDEPSETTLSSLVSQGLAKCITYCDGPELASKSSNCTFDAPLSGLSDVSSG